MHAPGADSSGDIALLADALTVPDSVVVTDDDPLRKTCKAPSIPIAGTTGVLVRAVERGELDEQRAKDVLYAMDEVGARSSVSLVDRAERLIEEAATERNG